MEMEVDQEKALQSLRSPSPLPLPKQEVPLQMEVSDDVTGPQEANDVEPPVDDTSEVILKITQTLEQTGPSVKPESESATSDESSSDVDIKKLVKQTLLDSARELAKEREAKPE
jgi:hypothetical protein